MSDAATEPAFFDNLELSLEQSRKLLEEGAANRRSPAHHPVVANIDGEGRPQQRVMILRELDWERRLLRFHTDARSDKVAQFAANSLVSVLIYDEAEKIQLRISGSLQVDTDTVAQTAWESSTAFARRCYLAEIAPGSSSVEPTSGLPASVEGVMPNEEQLAPARDNFAVLLVRFDQIEFLYLANAGHRRARWGWNALTDAWSGNWLVP